MARIVMTSPESPGSPTGNTVTALRWARILRSLGHRVTVVRELVEEPCDLLIALHATKSAASVKRASRRPGTRIVVALTGTDLYRDLLRRASTRRSLDLADRIVALQPLALAALSREHRGKAMVIHQSVPVPRASRPAWSWKAFDVAVLANLRAVKDPLRAAYAARLLPPDS